MQALASVPGRLAKRQRLEFIVSIVLLWFGVVETALAADLDAADENAPTQSVAIDGGVTTISPLSPYRLDAYLDALIAPAGDLDKSGFRLQLGNDDWSYRNVQNGKEFFGVHAGASLLVGYSWVNDSYSLLVMAGPDVQQVETGSQANATTTLVGLKSSVELDGQPTKNTMFSAQATFSTASKYLYSQIEVGYAIAQNLYVGPVLGFAGDYPLAWPAGGAEGRLGLGLSGIKIGRTELGFAAGYSQSVVSADSDVEQFDSGQLRDRNDAQTGIFVDTNFDVRF